MDISPSLHNCWCKLSKHTRILPDALLIMRVSLLLGSGPGSRLGRGPGSGVGNGHFTLAAQHIPSKRKTPLRKTQRRLVALGGKGQPSHL